MAAVTGFEWFLLGYFAALNLLYALFGYVGIRSVIVHARELSQVALKDLLERDFYKPVSILVPAYNEEASIVTSVRNLIELQHPEFEVVVTSDGSTDRTVQRLTEAFGLVETPQIYREMVPTARVERVLRSVRHPNLVVIEKENGGRADALNAALNVASYPLVCSVDADSLLDPQALLRASRMFVEDDNVIAAGGTIRPMNGAKIHNGRVVELRAPERWVERFQVLEYARAFFASRAAWSKIGALMVISGAFTILRRDAASRVGGFLSTTTADDMEIVIRLHRRYREAREPYRIVFTPDPVCWTEVPSDWGSLCRQRNGWQRGLWESLWPHKRMLFNPRYGTVGTVGTPYFWIFEGLAPIVEALGYVYIVVAAIGGFLSMQFAVLFLLLAVFYGVLLSELAMGIETLLLQRYSRVSDRLRLFAAAFVEFLGYRQLLTFVRLQATFQVRSRRGQRWDPARRGIGEPAEEVS